jgi:hypothetical protein
MENIIFHGKINLDHKSYLKQIVDSLKFVDQCVLNYNTFKIFDQQDNEIGILEEESRYYLPSKIK